MDLNIFIHIALILLGGYAMWAAVSMKKKKSIPNWMLKGYVVDSECDVEGFIKQMFGTTLYVGFLLAMYGVYNILILYVFQGLTVSRAVSIFFLIFALSYLFILAGAKSKYLKRQF